ncbi:MAG TPA: glycosyltransferase family 39 protein [Terriglobales bacterium]|nr:glycosyltransferase family 39 protein [Terriglobales bacterium]
MSSTFAASPRVPSLRRRLLYSPLAIVAVAFVARVVSILLRQRYAIPAAYGHLFFGFEVGRIASALASGHGFSSPFPGPSGPTAWLGPVYPLLVAGVFKTFGIYTAASALAIMVINSVFSALTCLAIYLVGMELFSPAVAVLAAWAWALLPYSINWSFWIWETTISAFLLTLLFWLTLRLARQPRPRTWAVYGLLWGVLALTNASCLSFLPVAAVWLWYRLRPTHQFRFRHAAASALLFVLAVSPWVARNYLVMGKFIFPRSDFGEELYMGNHEGSEGLCMFWDHPVWNKYEMASFARQGELAYVAAKQKIAEQWIEQHPGRFAELTLKRVGFFWFTIPEQGRMARRFGIGSRHALYFAVALLAFWGLWLAFRRRHRAAWLFAGLFLFYPLVYYITHCHPRYQHPITPEMLLLAVFLLHSSWREEPRFLRFGRKKTAASSSADGPAEEERVAVSRART